MLLGSEKSNEHKRRTMVKRSVLNLNQLGNYKSQVQRTYDVKLFSS